MNELITINYENERPTVSGRELHEALEIKTAYKDWFPRMCEYGFMEGEDFNVLKNERVQKEGDREVVREITDHQLTIPMAKELCMLQRNEKGKQFRQYFIKVEEMWNTPEMVMKRALEFANKKAEELMSRLNIAEAQVEEDKPYVLVAKAIDTAKSSILIGDLAKLLKQNGYETGQKRLFEQLRAEGYLIKGGNSKNMPTQKSMEMGLFEVKETSIVNPDGSVRLTKTTKVTGRGQIYFINKFLSGRAGDINEKSAP